MNQPAFTASLPLGTASFTTSKAVCARPRIVSNSARLYPVMVSQTNIAKKAEKVEQVKALLANSEMLFSVPLDGISVSEVTKLRLSLPEGSSAAAVKNTLMRRAIAESQWETAGELTKNSSLWFFVGSDLKGTVEAYEKFAKDFKKEEIIGGVFEGEKYDSKGITSIAALPSKKELIQKIAVALKMVPTKLGRSIKMVPTKVGRAIKLAVADEEDGESSE